MGALSFTFVDVLVVAVMLLSAILAAYRGFVRESLSVVAWVAAAFAALFFGPALTRALHGLLSGWTAIIVAYGLIFLVVVIPLSFVSYRFAQNVQRSPIGAVDRALGVVFGAVRGLVIIALLYILFGLFVPLRDQPRWMSEARFLPLIQSSSDTLLALLPDQHIDRVARHDDRWSEPATRPERHRAERRMVREDRRKHTVKKLKKTYGARDREALNRLIETNGAGNEP